MISEAIALIRRVSEMSGGRIICGVSGKDSLATLDLCCRVLSPTNVTVFSMGILPRLECEEATRQFVERRYGLVVHRFIHPDMSVYLKRSHLNNVRPEIEDLVQKKLRWAHIEAIMRSRSGVSWFAYGHRLTDSLQRRAMIKKHRGVIEGRRICYPIWDWNPTEVIEYLAIRKIPLPPNFGRGLVGTSGVSPHSVECLLFLRDRFPNDYRRILATFPGAAALIERDELRAKYQIECGAGLDEAEAEEVEAEA